ncbi:MAG TPA: VCBS repeat-containing protein, partial [Niastella sp.]
MKTFLFSLIAVLCFSPLFSQQLPAFNMKDTVITTTECYLYDPGGFKTGYADGTKVITFFSASGSTLGISFDSVRLNSDEMITVYDGSSVNTPQITMISPQYSSTWHVKSTGSSLTVKFSANPSGSTGAFGWGAHVRSLINNPLPTQFTPVFNGFSTGNYDLADYDHDGDMDILNGGKIFRNDSQADSMYRFVSQLYSPVGDGWSDVASAVADFNGDGFKDLFMTGQFGSNLTARLYFNNTYGGTYGGFILSSQSFPAAYKGRCVVVDYNRDGRPDISYIGSANLQESASIFKLYINNGNNTFTEQVTNVAGLYNSSLSWADTDNDGDMDLLLNGQEAAATPHARLLINNNNTFTEKNIGLAQSASGEISFADINKDGRPDIINTGV